MDNELQNDIYIIKGKINTINDDIRDIKSKLYDMKKEFLTLTNIVNKLCNNSKSGI